MKMRQILCFALLTMLLPASVMAQTAPVYVTLWFDTEDYILPQSDDAAKRLAEMLTRLGVKATFKIVGEKARVLVERGRRDVIAALRKHEIGYHSNYHSIHPTPAEYLQHTDWDDGVAEFYRRESPGVKDIERIFGVTPSCYGQPGSSWGPQSYPALRQMGINVYLDEADHVGIDDQPFYYGGMLNIFRMRSNVCRMELFSETNLEQGRAQFLAAYEKLKASGGGTISIYYHPCEWVHQEFWDGVNFSRGANPSRRDWKLPRTRSQDETEKAFRDFEEYVKFIRAQAGVRFVTADELRNLYADRAAAEQFTNDSTFLLARETAEEITFRKYETYSLSAAEIFAILTNSLLAQSGDRAARITSISLLGPNRSFVRGAGQPVLSSVTGEEFITAVREVVAYCRRTGRIPGEIWIGSNSISPQDYLATVAALVTGARSIPQEARIRKGNFTADKYVAADAPKIFNWVIHPAGFHAPKIMELARLQAWTLKPAALQR
jgi:hypothetical protein